jgi:hypothetical protein
MTNTQFQTIRRAITLLCSLIDEPMECAAVSWQSPIRRYVQQYLVPDPNADLSCAEAWQFFQEIAQAGELEPMRKVIFLRQLPTVMEAVFRVRKCHNILRSGSRVRGFRGVGLKMDAGLPLGAEAEPGLG